MFAGKSRRRGFGLRAAVVLAATGALVFGGTAAASAQGNDEAKKKSASAEPNSALPPGGAKIGMQGDSVSVQTNEGKAPIVEITLTFSDGTVKHAYCIDYQHHAGRDGTQYDAGKWDESNVNNLPKIQWILQHSFPNQDATPLLKAAGVTDIDGLKNKELDAYAGTQTAIWHYSDRVELQGPGSLRGADYQAAEKVHDYLIDQAKEGTEPPAPQLSISPEQATGHVGDKAGPFTVKATGVKQVSVTADNGQVVDENGKAVTSVTNGGKFWVKTDSEGTVSVTATGSGTLPSGSVFMVKGHENTYQKLILADTATQQVGAKVSVSVTAQPSASPTTQAPSPSASPSETSAAPASPSASGTAGGGLPVTGTSLPIIIGVALVLLAGGGAAVFMARRRRLTH